MSKLSVDQKTVMQLLSDKKSNFLIPDYQRPYAWDDNECRTLWSDVFEFAFPENNPDNFNSSDEYFLGPIVVFKNDRDKLEVIDGQQRLTTILLLLRAFYEQLGDKAQDKGTRSSRGNIEKCIWKTDEFDDPDKDILKFDSEVASDDDKNELISILKTGRADGMRSRYAENYRFFQGLISDFLKNFAQHLPLFPQRLLNNCVLLPIEADSQDTALRIFSTLNDRGKPLSDADIFKAQLYKVHSAKGNKDGFIMRWKALEEKCGEIFKMSDGTPMDEIFTRYMYYERAKKGIKLSTTEALRKFYEKDGYELLKREIFFNELEILADFWERVSKQDNEYFSDDALRRLFVLNYAPNGMWTYITSVYFMHNKDGGGNLDSGKFCRFLDMITAFIWAYSVRTPGVNMLRTPIYAEMVNIVGGRDVTFDEFKFDGADLRNSLRLYSFSNNRPITKSMLAWRAFRTEKQTVIPPLSTDFQIEHIFAKNRCQNDKCSLSDQRYLELLGNKSLLERGINIRASDYQFADKKSWYTGERGRSKRCTEIAELIEMSGSMNDFTEADILRRNDDIIDSFIAYLGENGLLK